MITTPTGLPYLCDHLTYRTIISVWSPHLQDYHTCMITTPTGLSHLWDHLTYRIIIPVWSPHLQDYHTCVITIPAKSPHIHDYHTCGITIPAKSPHIHDYHTCGITIPAKSPDLWDHPTCGIANDEWFNVHVMYTLGLQGVSNSQNWTIHLCVFNFHLLSSSISLSLRSCKTAINWGMLLTNISNTMKCIESNSFRGRKEINKLFNNSLNTFYL